MIRVVIADEAFRVAAAALPRRARMVSDPAGAVVAGRSHASAAVVVLRVDGVAAGAHILDEAGVTVADAARAPDAMERPPVVLVRRFLRPDVVSDALAALAGARPRVVVAECAATSPDDPVLLDAVGWLRVLLGSPLDLVAADRSPSAALAAFRAADGLTATLSATLDAPRSWVRVRALGETTVEVVVDAVGRATITTSTPAGALASPRRWESAERLALRRALDVAGRAATDGAATTDGAETTDLADLAHDVAAAAMTLDGAEAGAGAQAGASSISHVDPGDRRPVVALFGARAETGDAAPGRDRR